METMRQMGCGIVLDSRVDQRLGGALPHRYLIGSQPGSIQSYLIVSYRSQVTNLWGVIQI